MRGPFAFLEEPMPRHALLVIALAAVVAGCGGSTAPSAEQNRALDDAGRMLDEAPAALNEVQEDGLAADAASEPGSEG